MGVINEAVGSLPQAGAVNVIYGKAAVGLNATGAQLWHQDVAGVEDQAETSDRFGFALAAGDFNKDGADDLAVGAAFETVGTIGAGAVNVLYGGANRLTATNDQLWHRNVAGIKDAVDTGDVFGGTLAAGDFNNDGFADLAVGVPNDDVNGKQTAGAVNVLYGRSGGLAEQDDQVFHRDLFGGQAKPTQAFGAALAAGDFDGDGFTDLAFGVPGEDAANGNPDFQQLGAVDVIYGSPNRLVADRRQFFNQNSFLIAGIADSSEHADHFGAALTGGIALGFAGLSGSWEKVEERCGGSRCTLKGRFEVTNPGTAIAGKSLTEFYLSADAVLDETDVLIRTKRLKVLAPDASRIQRVQVKLAPGQSAKGMFLIAKLDAQNVVPEAREDNNVVVSPPIE